MKKAGLWLMAVAAALCFCLVPYSGKASGDVDVTCHITVHNLEDVQHVTKGDSGVYEVSVDPVDGVEITDPVEFVSGNEDVLEITSDGHWEAVESGTATVWMVVTYSQETWNKLLAVHPEADRLVTSDQGQEFAVMVDVQPGTLFRLYNPHSGEHFYTQNVIEQRNLGNFGWIDEGAAWICPLSSENPVYRLYNPNGGDHHFTSDQRERDYLSSVGWIDEGLAFYAFDSAQPQAAPVFRLYNPNAETGSHHYTLSERERNFLVQAGWNDEGIAWYAKAVK